jgi:DtxR family Mn-dependent transcriptional regulator
VEDYLKAVFALTAGGDPASTSAIAQRVGVAPPSASAMIRRLRAAELVEQATWGQVVLTTHGYGHARQIVRRHRLLETFLHRVLGLGWDQVHAEAEVLEHGLSDHLEDLLDFALGFPDRDPHGDPIPAKTGAHLECGEAPLASAEPGDRFLVERVRDVDSDALRRLGALGIYPGLELEVEAWPGETGSMWVRIKGQRQALSQRLVDLIHGHVVLPQDAEVAS